MRKRETKGEQKTRRVEDRDRTRQRNRAETARDRDKLLMTFQTPQHSPVLPAIKSQISVCIF